MRTVLESEPKTNAQQLVITRVFDAPRERVWEAWTEAEDLKQWFGPETFTTPYCTVDLRVGGGFHLAMRSPEGKDFWVKGIYRELARPSRLVYSDYFSDEAGAIVSPAEYGMSTDFPRESLITITFDEQGAKTKMTMVTRTPEIRERHDAEQGWNQSFDKLAKLLGAGRV